MSVSESDPDHETAICKHCRRPIWHRVNPEPGEWAHYPGSPYCQTPGGFTNSRLLTATPMSHPKEGFDEGDYEPISLSGYEWDGYHMERPRVEMHSCKRCATVTIDRGTHDLICPAKKELR